MARNVRWVLGMLVADRMERKSGRTHHRVDVDRGITETTDRHTLGEKTVLDRAKGIVPAEGAAARVRGKRCQALGQ